MSGWSYRALEPDELPFVLDSWSRSWRTSEYAGTVPNHLQPTVVRELLGGLLARGAKITVAVIGSRIAGYVCHERKGKQAVIHWAYVKDPFRRQGIGSSLVLFVSDLDDEIFYTHRTRYSKYILPANAKFLPEIARRKDL